MTRCSNRVLSMLLWFFGGTVYFFLEVAYKTIGGHPERPWAVPLPVQALACTAAITACELAAGLVLNVWLDIGAWDYSHMWGNLWGQICPQYAALWFALSLVMIPAFDWIRWAVEGGERPHYK